MCVSVIIWIFHHYHIFLTPSPYQTLTIYVVATEATLFEMKRKSQYTKLVLLFFLGNIQWRDPLA